MVHLSAIGETPRPRGQPTVFGPPDRRLFGLYHPCNPATARGVGVVLCNPLGYEAMSAHRTYRELAERFAGAGYPAFRFDYSGTGDSSGDARDPDRVPSWIDDVRAAIAELRQVSGVHHVALFGVRFGASLATVAASEEHDVDALVAWAPVVSGRAHVRELRAFRMLKDPAAKRPDGSEEVGGYFFARETLAGMAAIDLVARADRRVDRVLVVPRGAAPVREESELVEHWKTAGADAHMATESGYASMMRDDPYDSVVPYPTLDAIVAWLGAAGPRSSRAAPRSKPPPPVLAMGPSDEGRAVKETSIVFGDGARLLGIITEPAEAAAKSRPAICLLNVGADSHVGPHRMNVEHARELASMGYVTFRFDVGGLGESHAAPGQRENRLYCMDSIEDVRSAMTALARARGIQRFVLVGLCSGAFLAYHTTVVDPRVVGQVLLNMFAFEWREGDPVAPVERKTYQSSRFYAQALLDRQVWLRTIKGDVNVLGIAGVVAERLAAQVALEAQSLGARALGRHGQTPVERQFHAMCDRGVRSLMVFSDKDGGLDMIARYLGRDARRMTRRREFSIEVAGGVDHTFASIDSQRRLREIVARYVGAHFA